MWAPNSIRAAGRRFMLTPDRMRTIAYQLAYAAEHPAPVTLPRLKCLEAADADTDTGQ